MAHYKAPRGKGPSRGSTTNRSGTSMVPDRKSKKRPSRYGTIPEAGPVTVIKVNGTREVQESSVKEVRRVIREGQDKKRVARRPRP